MKPKLFIASSVEQLDLAYAAQEGLEHDAECTVWSQGVFALSSTAMASLIDELDETDFGLFILAPDDVTTMRDHAKQTARDNVIFELGLFIGRLGADRCFMFVPRGVEDLHLPTDLLGLAPAVFDRDRQDANLVAALGPACNRVRKAVAKLGSSASSSSDTGATSPPEHEQPLHSDQGDCAVLLASYLGGRTAAQNAQAFTYDEVDRELRLAPGSARALLKGAASRFNLEVAQEGPSMILFKRRPLQPPQRVRTSAWLG